MTSLQNFAHCTVGLHSTVQSAMQARRKVKKFGGASSNVVIIIYLSCWNRVNWSAENWGCQWHPWHPRLRRPWWCVGFSFTLYTNILYLGGSSHGVHLASRRKHSGCYHVKKLIFQGWQKAWRNKFYFYTRKNAKVHLHPLFYYPRFSVLKEAKSLNGSFSFQYQWIWQLFVGIVASSRLF